MVKVCKIGQLLFAMMFVSAGEDSLVIGIISCWIGHTNIEE